MEDPNEHQPNMSTQEAPKESMTWLRVKTAWAAAIAVWRDVKEYPDPKPTSVTDQEFTKRQRQEFWKQCGKIADNLGLLGLGTTSAVAFRELMDYGFMEEKTGYALIVSCGVYVILQLIALLCYSKADKQNIIKEWIKEK